MKVFYKIIRIWTAIFGILLVYSVIGWIINPPDIDAPGPLQATFYYGTFFLYGLFIVLPNKWTSKSFVFYIRIIFYMCCSCWIIILTIDNIRVGQPGILELLLGIALMVTVFATVVSLWISKIEFQNYY